MPDFWYRDWAISLVGSTDGFVELFRLDQDQTLLRTHVSVAWISDAYPDGSLSEVARTALVGGITWTEGNPPPAPPNPIVEFPIATDYLFWFSEIPQFLRDTRFGSMPFDGSMQLDSKSQRRVSQPEGSVYFNWGVNNLTVDWFIRISWAVLYRTPNTPAFASSPERSSARDPIHGNVAAVGTGADRAERQP